MLASVAAVLPALPLPHPPPSSLQLAARRLPCPPLDTTLGGPASHKPDAAPAKVAAWTASSYSSRLRLVRPSVCLSVTFSPGAISGSGFPRFTSQHISSTFFQAGTLPRDHGESVNPPPPARPFLVPKLHVVRHTQAQALHRSQATHLPVRHPRSTLNLSAILAEL